MRFPEPFQFAKSRSLAPALMIAAVSLGGCGYTDQEWQIQLDKSQRLEAKVQAAEATAEKALLESKQSEERAAGMATRLRAMGIDVESLESAERAMAEHQARARHGRAVEERVVALRTALAKIILSSGTTIEVRRKRLTITIPGDALFEAGKKTLSKRGEATLHDLAAGIAVDPYLKSRRLQIVGHTEAKPGADPFELSVLRARAVLGFLASEKGGKVPAANLSAAGYGDTDPAASGNAADAQKKNRRIEIVALPGDDEGL